MENFAKSNLIKDSNLENNSQEFEGFTDDSTGKKYETKDEVDMYEAKQKADGLKWQIEKGSENIEKDRKFGIPEKHLAGLEEDVEKARVELAQLENKYGKENLYESGISTVEKEGTRLRSN
jgi:hypothetical protein